MKKAGAGLVGARTSKPSSSHERLGPKPRALVVPAGTSRNAWPTRERSSVVRAIMCLDRRNSATPSEPWSTDEMRLPAALVVVLSQLGKHNYDIEGFPS